MVRLLRRCFGWTPAPIRDLPSAKPSVFVPAADLLSCARKKVGKESAPVPSPLRCAKGSPAMLEHRGSRGTHFATLRSDSRAKSVDEARYARASAFCASRLLQRGTPKHPTAKPGSSSLGRIRLTPVSTAEERKGLKPRAQHASTPDSAQLFEQSVAARVLRGASRPEYRRAPLAQRGARRSGGALCLLSGGPESRSPAGANSRHGRWRQAEGPQT